jgi:hypothetical protein
MYPKDLIRYRGARKYLSGASRNSAIAMKPLQSQEESPASFDAGRRGVNKRVPKSSPQEISVRDLSKGL